MSNISRFTIHRSTSRLSITFSSLEKNNTELIDTELNNDELNSAELSFEYLRVFAPTDDKGQPTGLSPKVYHKKQVQLLSIESVGKHGYRFIFDDNHSNIYSTAYLQTLVAEQAQRWQHYLKSVDAVANSREASIVIKELK